MNKETALYLIANGFEVVKDSKAKVVHKIDKVTGEHTVEYKVQYFLENASSRTDQRRITAALARQLGGRDIKEAATWSSLVK